MFISGSDASWSSGPHYIRPAARRRHSPADFHAAVPEHARPSQRAPGGPGDPDGALLGGRGERSLQLQGSEITPSFAKVFSHCLRERARCWFSEVRVTLSSDRRSIVCVCVRSHCDSAVARVCVCVCV